MKKSFKHLFLFINKSLHRFLLWMKPAYIRHRTPEQKRFDLKIQYTFLGCLIGMLAVALLLYYKTHHQTEQLAEISQQEIAMEETITSQETEKEGTESLDETEPLQISITQEEITTTEMTLNQNETLSGLLKRAGVPLSQALKVANSLDIVCDIKRFRPGQSFEIIFIGNNFQGLKLEDRKGQTISVLKNSNGEFIPQSKEGIIETNRFVLNGVIEDSFSESAQKVGVPKSIVQQVVLAMDGKIDFKKDLKKNAPFKIIYEQKMTQTGKMVGKSQLLYVSLSTNKQTYKRYFFVDAMGARGYYDENGESTPQTLMQRPLGNVRISSPFGMRLHPILGYQIQHKGVDFAAPLGTPIPAGADGVIQKITRNGGYGKFILIKHNSTYSTAYGHLNDYADDLRVGSNVKKGEIIGYVGNTGRSTGPHLHYEVIKNNEPVNPLKKHTIPKRVLKNQSFEQFKKKKQFIDSL